METLIGNGIPTGTLQATANNQGGMASILRALNQTPTSDQLATTDVAPGIAA